MLTPTRVVLRRLHLNVKRSHITNRLPLRLPIGVIRTILKDRLASGSIRRSLSHLTTLMRGEVPSVAVFAFAHFIDIIIGATIRQG